MSKLSDDAFAILAACEEGKGFFGITVDRTRRNEYRFCWAFKIYKDKAHREGFDEAHVKGRVIIDSDYPGCPYCGNKDFYVCGNCGNVVCYHGQLYVSCPHCGSQGEVKRVDELNLKGGGF